MSYYLFVPLLFVTLLGGGMVRDYIEVKYNRIDKEKEKKYMGLVKED
jgi:hypothetical protein